MPIRFQCEHCSAKLSVGSKKSGKRVKCPRCAQIITIPSAEQPSSEDVPAPQPAAQQHEQKEHSEDIGHHEQHEEQPADHESFSQFAVYDADTEWVYEDSESVAAQSAYEAAQRETAPVDRKRLAVSRSVLYVQGGLLGVVAITCFALGILVGWGSADGNGERVATPCVISGTVTFAQAENPNEPDDGAIVVVVPRDARPGQGEKLGIEAFRPGSEPLDVTSAEVQALQGLGGNVARTDAEGKFSLRVPDKGNYFVLVLSGNSQRGGAAADINDLAEIGRYFLTAADLVGTHSYRWTPEPIGRDRTFHVQF